MNGLDELGHQLRRHYLATADEQAADGQLEVVLDRTRAARQRPGWLARLREPFLRWEARRVRATPMAWIAVLLVLAALIGVMLALALGATRAVPTTPLVFTTALTESGDARLYVVDIATGSPLPVFEAYAQRIHVSPDGRYALFEGLEQDGAGLVLARTDGSSAIALPDSGEYELGRSWESVWAPDSHAVAWLSWQAGKPTLMVADVAGDAPQRIAVPFSEDPHLVWSPDNVHIAYVDWGCETLARQLSIVNTRSRLTSELGDELFLPRMPVWAHDGRRIAIVAVAGEVIAPTNPDPDSVTCADRSGPDVLVVGNIETGTTTTLAENLDAFNLAWTADDRTIMGIVAAASGGNDVVSFPADGGQRATLAHLAEGAGAMWSPDGAALAWTQSDGSPEETFSLWTIRLPDAQPRVIAHDVPGGGPEGWPKWSPDGAWIAFHRAPSDPDSVNGGSIYIVRPDGSGERLLVDEGSGVDLTGVDW